MTLHALRLQIGDPAFFRILRDWVRSNAGGNVAIPEFIALAERISGRQLDDFFDIWLFTPPSRRASSRRQRASLRQPRAPASTAARTSQLPLGGISSDI